MARGAAVQIELADIVRAHAPALPRPLSAWPRCSNARCARSSAAAPPPSVARSAAAITAAQTHYVYHSCRNRHCPKCQTLAKERWLAARRAELLPVPYFHLVFTLPHELNALAQGNPRAIYGLLFAAASQTLLEFGRNPRWLGGEIAATLVLHTWGQTLTQHLHVHALVAGGALAPDGGWISPRRGFLFPVKALSKVFRGKFLDALASRFATGSSCAAPAPPPRSPTRPHERAFLARASRHALGRLRQAHPRPVPSRCSTTSAATCSAWPSPTSACSASTQGSRSLRLPRSRPRQPPQDDALPATQFLERFLLHVLPSGLHAHPPLRPARQSPQARAPRPGTRRAQPPAPPPAPVESVQTFCLRVLGIDIDRCPICRIGTLRPDRHPRSAAPPIAHVPHEHHRGCDLLHIERASPLGESSARESAARHALTRFSRSAIVASTQSPHVPAHAARTGPASRPADAPSRALRPAAASSNSQTAVA